MIIIPFSWIGNLTNEKYKEMIQTFNATVNNETNVLIIILIQFLLFQQFFVFVIWSIVRKFKIVEFPFPEMNLICTGYYSNWQSNPQPSQSRKRSQKLQSLFETQLFISTSKNNNGKEFFVKEIMAHVSIAKYRKGLACRTKGSRWKAKNGTIEERVGWRKTCSRIEGMILFVCLFFWFWIILNKYICWITEIFTI